jgi:tryptophanyl-tRNA synthetase
MEAKPILMSGIKPTGEIHLGNYFGAIKQWVELLNDDSHTGYLMIADYHALNFIQNAEEMRQRTHELACAYLACGLDPEKVILFRQSAISAHTELAWIFDTITTMPYLSRAHAFKDAEAKNMEIGVGTFNYPMLMAADILLYGPDLVPVGQDQKQHIEYARDTAEKFNRIFGETFVLPKPYIMESVAVVPGTDGQKMSKSYGNTIPLFASLEVLTEEVMVIVTDSSGDVPENVYAIHRLIKSEAELAPLYELHKGKYKALKEALISDLEEFISPLRARYAELIHQHDKVEEILKGGEVRAKATADETLLRVKRAVGVLA